MTQRLAPDALLLQTNLVGAVSAITDDPDSPDATWLTASSSTAASILRVSFPTPTGSLPQGAGLQEFRVWVRKTNFSGTPTCTIELWENGVLKSTLLAATNVTSTTGQLLSATWNSSSLGTADGSQVELRLTGTVGGSGGNRATIEVGAVEWNATTGIWSVSIADSHTTTDAAARETDRQAPSADTLAEADAADTVVARSRVAADSLVTSDVAFYPIATFELWENGAFVASLGDFPVSDGVVSVRWDAALLAQISGAGVELRIVSSNGPMEIGAVEWNTSRAYVGDAAVQQHSISRTSADTETLVDVATPPGNHVITGTNDTLTEADANTRRNVVARPAPESTVTAETPTRDYDPKRALGETVSLAETLIREYDPKRATADSLTEADTASRGVGQNRAASESTVQGDSVVRDYDPKRALAETESTSEALTRDYDPKRATSDTLTTTEIAALTATRVRGVADTLTTADTAGRGVIEARQTSDAESLAETVVRAASEQRTGAETESSVDSATRGLADGRAVAETVTRTDTSARQTAEARTGGDALTETDASSATSTRPRAVSETLTETETVARIYHAGRSVSDTETTVEGTTRAEITTRVVGETESLTEVATRGDVGARTAADTRTLTDAVARGNAYARSTGDSETYLDTNGQLVVQGRTASDGLATSDAVQRSSIESRSLAEAVAQSDAAIRSLLLARFGLDTTSLADVAAMGSFIRSASDTVTISDSAGRSAAEARAAAETRTTSETVVRSLSVFRTVAETLGLTESLAAATYRTVSRTAADVVAEAESILRSEALARAPPETRVFSDATTATAAQIRSAAQTITFSDASTRGETLTRAGTETCTETETVLRGASEARTAPDSLTTVAASAITRATNRFPADALVETDAIVTLIARTRTVSDAVAFFEDLGGGAQFRSLGDTLTTTESAARGYHASRTANDTLTTTESLTAVTQIAVRVTSDVITKVESISQAIALARGPPDVCNISDTCSVGATRPRALTDVLTTTEAVSRTETLVRSGIDVCTANDVSSATATRTRAISETIASTESVGRVLADTRGATDTCTTTDVLSRAVPLLRTGSETCSSTETAGRSAALARASADTETFADTVIRTLAVGVAGSTAGVGTAAGTVTVQNFRGSSAGTSTAVGTLRVIWAGNAGVPQPGWPCARLVRAGQYPTTPGGGNDPFVNAIDSDLRWYEGTNYNSRSASPEFASLAPTPPEIRRYHYPDLTNMEVVAQLPAPGPDIETSITPDLYYPSHWIWDFTILDNTLYVQELVFSFYLPEFGYVQDTITDRIIWKGSLADPLPITLSILRDDEFPPELDFGPDATRLVGANGKLYQIQGSGSFHPELMPDLGGRDTAVVEINTTTGAVTPLFGREMLGSRYPWSLTSDGNGNIWGYATLIDGHSGIVFRYDTHTETLTVGPEPFPGVFMGPGPINIMGTRNGQLFVPPVNPYIPAVAVSKLVGSDMGVQTVVCDWPMNGSVGDYVSRLAASPDHSLIAWAGFTGIYEWNGPPPLIYPTLFDAESDLTIADPAVLPITPPPAMTIGGGRTRVRS